jgi:hypothetical protein
MHFGPVLHLHAQLVISKMLEMWRHKQYKHLSDKGTVQIQEHLFCV